MSLETKTPPKLIYRLGRYPDAWRPLDWSLASPDGTFDNRFDDPHSYYRVLYASTQEVSCFVETLARYRRKLTFFARLEEVNEVDDFTASGEIPSGWHENRMLGAAGIEGNYADICGAEWITLLREKLAAVCLRAGITDFDASVLQGASSKKHRQITQLASRIVYELDYPGIYYRSRYGHDFENWAWFEPFYIREPSLRSIPKDYPALLEAARILGLRVRA